MSSFNCISYGGCHCKIFLLRFIGGINMNLVENTIEQMQIFIDREQRKQSKNCLMYGELEGPENFDQFERDDSVDHDIEWWGE